MLKWQPCQGSELLLGKDIWTDSKGSTPMPSGPRIVQLGLELISLITLSIPDHDFDWTYFVYGDVDEILPDDMPELLGKAVVTTTTMDASLTHCLATGKSLTGCLHFDRETPVDWYSKKQATVETATYGSEFDWMGLKCCI